MTATSNHDHVWDIADTMTTCMLTTLSAGRLRSRPMHAIPDREDGCVWFITDHRGAKDDEIRAAPGVCLGFADTRSNTYLSMSGRAEMLCDAAKAGQLWSSEAQAWWPKGPSDPDVRVLARGTGQRRILGYAWQFDHGGVEARHGTDGRQTSGSWRERERAAALSRLASLLCGNRAGRRSASACRGAARP
jgi:general stress protein 26